MDQEMIGKLISTCRKEKSLTQQQLAEKLGVSDKSVSKWENGKCLPDVSLYKELCNILGLSLNEFFAGKKISDNNFKQAADENLYNVLENSAFNLKDKIKYYKKKWLKDHIFDFVICIISIIVVIVSLKIKNAENYLVGTICLLLLFIFYIVKYNQMMIYIEKNAYKKIDKK